MVGEPTYELVQILLAGYSRRILCRHALGLAPARERITGTILGPNTVCKCWIEPLAWSFKPKSCAFAMSDAQPALITMMVIAQVKQCDGKSTDADTHIMLPAVNQNVSARAMTPHTGRLLVTGASIVDPRHPSIHPSIHPSCGRLRQDKGS
jgi:hypothetical protein